MQGIGELIRLDPDKAGLRAVDGAVKFLRAAPELREVFPDHRNNIRAEGAASAQNILVKAALALVNAHGDAAVQDGVGQLIGAARVIEGVAPLVDHAVHGVGEIVLVIMRGNALVQVGAQRGGKGVLCGGEAHAVRIEAHQLHQLMGKPLLRRRREMPPENAAVRLGHGPHLVKEGDNVLPEGVEEAVAALHGDALLIAVEPVIVGQLLRRAPGGDFFVVVKNLREQRLKELPVAGLLGREPDVVCLHQQPLVCHIVFHRDFLHHADILEEELNFPPFVLIQVLPVFVKEFQQRDGFLACAQDIGFLAENSEGLRPVVGNALRRSGDAIVRNQIDGVVEGCQFLLQYCELFSGFLKNHCCISCISSLKSI